MRSITSRGSAEIDLFFDWHVDMVTTLQLVDAALVAYSHAAAAHRRPSKRTASASPAFPSSATA